MDYYLFGAANPEAIRMARAVERSSPQLVIKGFLDNDPAKQNTEFFGIPVVGGIEKVRLLSGSQVRFVNLISRNTRVRHLVTKQIKKEGGELGRFIHPSVDLTLVNVGTGVYIQENVTLQAMVSIGEDCCIHVGSLIAHETRLGNSVFISSGVSITGCCEIGDGAYVGSNATILPRLKVGKWAIVGAGAVVTKDVPDLCVVVGNPARIIRQEPPVDEGGL